MAGDQNCEDPISIFELDTFYLKKTILEIYICVNYEFNILDYVEHVEAVAKTNGNGVHSRANNTVFPASVIIIL